MKHILLSNDDGLESIGLKALQKQLQKLGKVFVVAPAQQQSAVSQSITIFQPIFVRSVSYGNRQQSTYSVHGTPTDCIKLALVKLMKQKPSFAVVGINDGANVGVDTFYSGTVGAALEAALWRITSFAISLEQNPHRAPDFQGAARIASGLIKSIMTQPHPYFQGTAFNINLPAMPSHRIKGVKYTRQDNRFSPEEFVKGIDPRGRVYYWMKAGPKARPYSSNKVFPFGQSEKNKTSSSHSSILPSDIEALQAGYISITPLKSNLTAYQTLLHLPKHLKF